MGTTVRVQVCKPTPENFARFGTLLALPAGQPSVDLPGVLHYIDLHDLGQSQGVTFSVELA